jgi:hypothetical protein
VTTSITVHIERFTSASSPPVFPLVIVFTIAARLLLCSGMVPGGEGTTGRHVTIRYISTERDYGVGLMYVKART